jgi:uncharacterized 2Fe-2S/4Fe-4S cluster protein (DUF4445 family)
MNNCQVILQPGNRQVNLPLGSNLYQELCRLGLYVHNACGGRARCGKCGVRLISCEPLPALTSEEKEYLTAEEIARGLRLACCILVQEGMEVEVVRAKPQSINQHGECYLPSIPPRPAVEKIIVKLPALSPKKSNSFLEHVEQACGTNFHPGYLVQNLARLPALFSKPQAKVTAVFIDHKLALLEPGDTRSACYAAAVDIGTTTLDVSLVDLKAGREVGALAALNSQLSYGMDVLSRISSCQNSPQQLKKMQHQIVGQINSLLKQVARESGVNPKTIYQLVVVGNTTMLHIFAGVNPRSIGRAPYIPAFTSSLRFRPTDCRIGISPGGEVILLPAASAYIGADILAGILVNGIFESNIPALFIDLGTNGEVVLAQGQKILAASCAAGPALEGMNISCGMSALPGAIEKIFFDRELDFKVIGAMPPHGLCGSAVIDLAAEMVRCGVVDKRGRIKDKNSLLTNEHAWLAKHIAESHGERVFSIYEDPPAKIFFSQTDFRQIQLARGAICSAIEILLTESDLNIEDVGRFIIAGRFGKSIRAESFWQLKIIPKGYEGQIEYAGNAAKAGAMMVAIDSGYAGLLNKIRRRVKTIELSTYPGYDKLLMKHLVF